MKPILFNTDMVRAILDGRKTVTRRVVKPQFDTNFRPELFAKIPYSIGDILYVREAFSECADGFAYRADYPHSEGFGWRPSIHMPREAARIFLRVTDVRVERLQDITDAGIISEGVQSKKPDWLRIDFADVWNSTIKPTGCALYGWAANPWVWVIEFERISKEEAQHDQQPN